MNDYRIKCARNRQQNGTVLLIDRQKNLHNLREEMTTKKYIGKELPLHDILLHSMQLTLHLVSTNLKYQPGHLQFWDACKESFRLRSGKYSHHHE